MAFEQGPYIQVAAFCEMLLVEKDGVHSLIRIIDTLTHTAAGPDAPPQMPPVPHTMKLVIILKSGKAKGRHELRIIPELPSGETKPPFQVSVQMEGEERGQAIAVDMLFTFTIEGLYWFNVYFDDGLLTRMPFRVKYMRLLTMPVPSQNP